MLSRTAEIVQRRADTYSECDARAEVARDSSNPYGKKMSFSLRMLIAFKATMLSTACNDGGGIGTRAYASPDHAYVAVLISEVASGGIGGSACTDTVVVVPRGAVASGVYPANSRAYIGQCHGLMMASANGQKAIPSAPQLRWTGPRELSIVFEPKRAGQGSSRVYSASSLYGGAIKIRNETQ